MAGDKKISDFTIAGPITDADWIAGLQSADDAKFAATRLKAYLGVGSAAPTVIAGTTSGSANAFQTKVGANDKEVRVYLNAYYNSTITAQTFAYPTAFATANYFDQQTDPEASTNLTTLTLPASMAGPVTGWIVIKGY